MVRPEIANQSNPRPAPSAPTVWLVGRNHFIDGRVDEIRYYKVNPKDSKKTSCPSEAEVNILLRANAQDTTWEVELAQLGDTLWRNREKGLSAFRTPRALTISIADPAAYKAFHERKTAARDLEAF